MEKKIIEVDGIKVAILTSGQGKPLLMLHGWGGAKEGWLPLIGELEKDGVLMTTTCVAVDLPGFGMSGQPSQAWSVNDYAQFTEKLIKELYKEFGWSGNYDLIVHSFGGRIALKILAPEFDHQITELPDRLILVAAAGIKPKKTMRVKVARLAASAGKRALSLPILRWSSPLAKKILYKALRTHDYEKTNEIMRETFLKVIDEDLRDNVVHIKNPTLLIWGKKDSYVPYLDALYMHHRIMGSKLITFNEGRHGIHKTHATEIAAMVKEFLGNNT